MIARSIFRFLAVCAFAVVLMLCAVLPCRAFAVSQFADDARRAQEEEKAARKFDEFEELRGECDLGARLDNLVIQLQSEPESKGFVIVYSGKYDLPATISTYRARIGNYLVNMRGVDPERLVILDGGYKQNVTTEFWIAAKGATAPEPTETINVKQELDKAFKFTEERVYLPDNSPQLAEEFVEETETIGEAEAEAGAAEAVAEQPVEAQEEEAAQARAEESEEAAVEAEEEEETGAANVWWASKNYARALEMEAKSHGLIIFYADREYADFSRMKEVVELAKKRLVEKYGVKAERLTLTFGGYRKSSAVELWLVPANASVPLPTPDPEQQAEAKEQAK